MIAEIGVSLTVLKEAFGFLKVIQDAKSDAEIQQATFDLRDRLSTLQMQNINLEELINSYREKVVKLEKEKADRDSFDSKSKSYVPHKMESGTFTYISKFPVEDDIPEHYLCANCYQDSVISILQPRGRNSSFFESYCPKCSAEFHMNRVPTMKPIHVPPSRRW
ncbi:TPA: hypothetical protein PXM37_002758 [Yersinia enterocolitica]|nr:hypothetical protein [Yersinia enterocolitica]HDL6982578.1 hypothetical protein [Yersinia enterocolitica]HDL7066397.1 hypothetical protein [Yersinia enterocolitica]HDL7070783.1 hypothetical protein [Yersinia enterocolitica]